MIKDKEKLKMLEEILNSDAVMKEPVGVLKVTAAGKSPEEAKKKIMQGLRGINLPDEEQMEPAMEEEEGMEVCPECGQEMCEDCMGMEDSMDPAMEEEEDMGQENKDILSMVPDSQRAHIKKMLLAKIKNM